MASPISTAAMISFRPVRDFVCSWEGAGLLEWGGMSLLLKSGQLMLSLIFQLFGVVLRAIPRCARLMSAPISGQNHSFHRDTMLSL